jgi:hypothetical protein
MAVHSIIPALTDALIIGPYRRLGDRQCMAVWGGIAILLLLTGCAGSRHPQPSLEPPAGIEFKTSRLLEQHPWIKDEIRQFLDQEEVRAGLGFDPLSYETPFTLTLLEQRLTDQGIIRMFGTAANQNVYVRAGLFRPATAGNGDTVAYLETDPDAVRKQRMLRVLSADPNMLALYRNLLICHEIAHVGEWYALTRRGEVVHYTGHGIRDRAEMRILTRLLHAGKVRPEAYAKLFLFYATFMNQDAEPEDDVARYYRQALSPYGVLSSADPMADSMAPLGQRPVHPR